MKTATMRNIAIVVGAIGAGLIATAGGLGVATAATAETVLATIALCMGALGGGCAAFSGAILKFYPAPPPA